MPQFANKLMLITQPQIYI